MALAGGILDNGHSREKCRVDKTNLKDLGELKKEGVDLCVCGQNLSFAKIDPKALTSDAIIASDALIVLTTYQNSGYAFPSY